MSIPVDLFVLYCIVFLFVGLAAILAQAAVAKQARLITKMTDTLRDAADTMERMNAMIKEQDDTMRRQDQVISEQAATIDQLEGILFPLVEKPRPN